MLKVQRYTYVDNGDYGGGTIHAARVVRGQTVVKDYEYPLLPGGGLATFRAWVYVIVRLGFL